MIQLKLKLWSRQVVISEIGKDIPFQKLLNCPVGFKGRAQQIQSLQLKVRLHIFILRTLCNNTLERMKRWRKQDSTFHYGLAQQTGAAAGEEAERED